MIVLADTVSDFDALLIAIVSFLIGIAFCGVCASMRVERGIEALTAERDRLQAELHRCRTTETASAHALDVVRQHHGLPLIPGEHPSDTAKRLADR